MQLQIQTKISEKPLDFCGISFIFLEYILNFQSCERNMSVIGQISEVIDSEKCVYLDA